jgi:hypothetical protein
MSSIQRISLRPFVISAILLVSPSMTWACTDTAYRAWDFWIGDWHVTSADGTFQGTNSITSEESGCLLVERWKGAKGGSGQSYNFYDPATRIWRQVWISASTIIDYAGAPTLEGAMRLEGTITYRANGGVHEFYGQWSPQQDGTLLQELFQWDADAGTWRTWFHGIYTRADAKTN